MAMGHFSEAEGFSPPLIAFRSEGFIAFHVIERGIGKVRYGLFFVKHEKGPNARVHHLPVAFVTQQMPIIPISHASREWAA